ncbi:MAG: hypothetical protein ACYTHN_22235, partial [Planctomycetota bacterium]
FLQVGRMIRKGMTGAFTHELQKAIEKTLEDLIEAVTQEVEQKQGKGGGGGGGDQDQPLLPTTAELKLIKALQERVNKMTKTVDAGRKPEGEFPAEEQERLKLTTRKQNEVAKITRELHERLHKEK